MTAYATATQQDPRYITVPAGSDLSTKTNYFMTVTSGQLAVPSSGGRVIGVLDNGPDAADKPGTIQYSGVALVYAAGSINAGDAVSSTSAGKAQAATGSALVAGIALRTVAADEYCPVLLQCNAAVAALLAEETKTSGALTVGVPISYLSVTSAVAFTLADGEYVGQRKYLECTVAATSPAGTLTINDAYSTESTVHVFTAVGQALTLEWRTGGWKVIAKKRAGRQAVVVGTTVLTGYDMAAAYDLSVTGTVHSTGTKGIPSGTLPGETIHIDVLTAASTATGDIDITAKTTVGVAATNWGSTGTSIGSAGTNTTAVLQAEWDGTAWQALIVTTATLA